MFHHIEFILYYIHIINHNCRSGSGCSSALGSSKRQQRPQLHQILNTGYRITDPGYLNFTLDTEYWIRDTCHCIKTQDEKGRKDSLCCEKADGEGEDHSDVVVGHRDHLGLARSYRQLAIGNCNVHFDMISLCRIKQTLGITL